MDLRATPRRLATLLAAAVAAAALAVPTASAASDPPASPSPRGSKARLGFLSQTTRLAGPGALVDVKCVSPAARECVGTLTLSVAGGSEEVPYSLSRGEKRTMVVPLGASAGLFGAATTVKAVAETLQPLGAPARSSRLLRIR